MADAALCVSLLSVCLWLWCGCGVIVVVVVAVVVVPRWSLQDGHEAANFQLNTPARTFHMAADSHVEMLQWVEAFKRNIGILRHQVEEEAAALQGHHAH
jgi:hypothetical protein